MISLHYERSNYQLHHSPYPTLKRDEQLIVTRAFHLSPSLTFNTPIFPIVAQSVDKISLLVSNLHILPAQYLAVKKSALFAHQLNDEQALLLLPLAIAIYLAEQLSRASLDSTPIIITGTSEVALILTLLLQEKNVPTILIDINDYRLNLAKSLGAHSINIVSSSIRQELNRFNLSSPPVINMGGEQYVDIIKKIDGLSLPIHHLYNFSDQIDHYLALAVQKIDLLRGKMHLINTHQIDIAHFARVQALLASKNCGNIVIYF